MQLHLVNERMVSRLAMGDVRSAVAPVLLALAIHAPEAGVVTTMMNTGNYRL